MVIDFLWLAILAGLLAVVYGAVQTAGLLKKSPGNARMQEIAAAIQEGAQAYLNRQYTTIGIVGVLVIVVLAVFFKSWEQPVGFAVGAILSGAAGFVGMLISVRANVRTAQASSESLAKGLNIAFTSGAITGMLVAGLALIGVAGYYWVLTGPMGNALTSRVVIDSLVSLGFGASLISIFARLGGGIFTKGADVGGDMVGKVEAGIPEDDPRNAATIADNVGDNVGDCAGMAADIFESYEVTIVAAMILGYASFGHKGVIFPLLVRAIGVVGSIISTYSVKAGPQSSSDEALHSVHRGFILGSIISVVGFVLLGLGYLHFDDNYVKEYPQALGGYQVTSEFATARDQFESVQVLDRTKPVDQKAIEFRSFVKSYPGAILAPSQPLWASFGFG